MQAYVNCRIATTCTSVMLVAAIVLSQSGCSSGSTSAEPVSTVVGNMNDTSYYGQRRKVFRPNAQGEMVCLDQYEGKFVWVLLNSGSSGAYAFNHDADTLEGAHSYRQPAGYFPIPGGTMTGESLPGEITWARAYIRNGDLWMDIGRGEVVALPPETRDEWWNGTTREWPFMAASLGVRQETIMAHYMSNHIAVAYGDIFGEMVALSQSLGFKIRILSAA